MEPQAHHPRQRRNGWAERAKRLLYPYRPRFRDWHFWAVQGFILVISGVHSSAEILKLLGHAPYLGSEPRVALASFITVSMFFIPVVYAALNFGFAGSIATALWCTFLTIPNLVVYHEGTERVRELMQIGMVDAIAVFVGQRVDQEVGARQRAEAAESALKVSERKYRGLFESSPVAILVLESTGVVQDANPAAGDLFESTVEALIGKPVTDLLGLQEAHKLLESFQRSHRQDINLVLRHKGGQDIYIEPTVTEARSSEGTLTRQVLLRDITLERHRQAGLRAYAAYVLRAQEEERKRIALELHDEAVQELVLLCRQLDAVESSANSAPASITQGIRGVRKSAEEVVQWLRDFARSLRPPTLEDLGLVTSVRRLLVTLMEQSNIDGQLKLVGREKRLHPDIELGIFRIVQEALRNVARHASATQVTTTIFFGDEDLKVEVADNGVGFTSPSEFSDLAASGQLGLLGMQERTELLGGRLEIQSKPGRGTRVSVLIPIKEKAPVP